MDEKDFASFLENMFLDSDVAEEMNSYLKDEHGTELKGSIGDFSGYLTTDTGIIVRLANGDEFQLTIVQSKYGTDKGDEEDDN